MKIKMEFEIPENSEEIIREDWHDYGEPNKYEFFVEEYCDMLSVDNERLKIINKKELKEYLEKILK